MNTWSIESAYNEARRVVKANLAPIFAPFFDALYPPLTHDWDREHDGAEQRAEYEAEEEVGEPQFAECPTGFYVGEDEWYCTACNGYFNNEAEFAAHRYGDDDSPSPDELSTLSAIRFGDQTSPAALGLSVAADAHTAAAGDSDEAVSVPIPPGSPASSRPDWIDWATPAICEVLAEHVPERRAATPTLMCRSTSAGKGTVYLPDWQAWREHCAPLIAERLHAAMESAPRPDIEVTTSQRGFLGYGDPVLTTYGHEVRVYESSAADAPHIWLGIEHDGARSGIQACRAMAHLSIEQAIAIRDRLNLAIQYAQEQ